MRTNSRESETGRAGQERKAMCGIQIAVRLARAPAHRPERRQQAQANGDFMLRW